MDENNRQQALADEILSDARRQAGRKTGRAKRTAESILRNARSQAEEIERTATEAAERKAERAAATVMADLPYQEQARILRAKDDVVGRLFADSLEALEALPPGEMLSILAGLTVEAIGLMPGGRFVLELRAKDAEQFGAELDGQAAAETRRTTGRDITVEIATSPELTGGGVIVRSADGPKMVDNSFAARIRRCRQRLRGEIAEIVFGDGSE
ncbi:MAG: V-type ATP synthase subunit E family protein [Planctomycetota bacterium]